MRDRKTRWFMIGSEICSGCEHGYSLEMEYRCVACDRGMCEHCVAVVRETREIVCHECLPLVSAGA